MGPSNKVCLFPHKGLEMLCQARMTHWLQGCSLTLLDNCSKEAIIWLQANANLYRKLEKGNLDVVLYVSLQATTLVQDPIWKCAGFHQEFKCHPFQKDSGPSSAAHPFGNL